MPWTDSSLDVVSGFLEELMAHVTEARQPRHPVGPLSLVAEHLEDLISLKMDTEPSPSPPSPSFRPPAHPLPCSQDFLFFKTIAESQVQLFPDSETSSTGPGLTPPWQLVLSPSPGSQHEVPSWAEDDKSKVQLPGVGFGGSCRDMKILDAQELVDAIAQSSQESLFTKSSEDNLSLKSPMFRRSGSVITPSCGVALKPMSQASLTSSGGIFSQEEMPTSKRIRMEDTSPEHFQDLKDVDLEENTTLPLTFHTKADLLWKLQRADLLPGLDTVHENRPGQSKEDNRQNIKTEREKSSSKGSLMNRMEPQECQLGPAIEEGDLDPHKEESKSSPVAKEGDLDPYQEDDPFHPPGMPVLSPTPKLRASLLHRAPR